MCCYLISDTQLQVLALLSRNNEKIVNEVFAFLNVVLESGNTRVQEGLNDMMMSKNHPIFSTLQSMLKEAAIAYTEKYSHWNIRTLYILYVEYGWMDRHTDLLIYFF